jgi:transglutaminase-like putative cysteine protease
VLPELERARAIFRFVQWGITYRRDPATWRDGQRHGIEVLDNSLVALDRGFGDCDAKARLLVALCLAAGLDAKIDPVIRHGSFVHVRAQICVEGLWLVADPSILNSDVGELPARAITNLRAS